MSQAPPPYPGNPNPAYPPPQNPAYADKAGQFQPPPPGYGQPAQPAYGGTGYPGPAPGYAPPPPQGYPGQPMHPGQYPPGPPPPGPVPPPTTVIVTQPQVMTTMVSLRDMPASAQCPYCQASIVTSTHYETGTFTWLLCAVLCLVGCDAGCCLIPFCVDGTKDCVHTCPNCKQQVSRWNRL